ncbi:PilZ domain-containing protein [Salaquimonas pukyongi]|uniref:PilZ domain-containing protein n=1 Tax=Salaquimonas pukyongi TaxID=2712698 RepID=UPI00096B82E2|nr:PilZ domain-containing protein [Salaquimonas pukyongi]
MTAFAKKEIESLLSDTEREFSRVDLTLFGRFMLENRQEYPCQVLNMSPGSAALIAPVSGSVGERVIAYVDHVGRLEGKILRLLEGGFAMSVNATERKRDKLAAKLTWLANRHELNLPEDRRHERISPRNAAGIIKLEDGRVYQARIIDLSLSGAALELNVKPAIGTVLWLGRMRGRVVRHFDEGVAIEFAIVQTRDSLEEYLGR